MASTCEGEVTAVMVRTRSDHCGGSTNPGGHRVTRPAGAIALLAVPTARCARLLTFYPSSRTSRDVAWCSRCAECRGRDWHRGHSSLPARFPRGSRNRVPDDDVDATFAGYNASSAGGRAPTVGVRDRRVRLSRLDIARHVAAIRPVQRGATPTVYCRPIR